MAEKKVIELEVNSNLGNLKQQLKQAQVEVQTLSEKFGATSKQAVEAAKAAAILKDKISDAKTLTDAFNPDAKFKSVAGALTGVAGSFSVVTGAMGAFGKQSEDVEKALLKVQSVMAITSGAQAIGESIDSFKALGAVIKSTSVFQGIYNFVQAGSIKATAQSTVAKVADAQATVAQGTATVVTTAATNGASMSLKILRAALISTGIGAIVVGIGLLMSNLDSLLSFIQPVIDAFKALGDFIGLTDFAGEERAEAETARYEEEKKQKEALVKLQEMIFQNAQSDYDRQIAINDALGISTAELTKQKIQASIDYQEQLKNEIQLQLDNLAIYQEMLYTMDDGSAISEMQFASADKLATELQEKLNTAEQSILNSKNQLAVGNINENKKQAAAASESYKKRIEKESEFQKKRQEIIKKGLEDAAQIIIDKIKNENETLESAEDLKISMLTEGKTKQLALLEETYGDFRENLIKKANQKTIDNLEKAYKSGVLSEKIYREGLKTVMENGAQMFTDAENKLMVLATEKLNDDKRRLLLSAQDLEIDDLKKLLAQKDITEVDYLIKEQEIKDKFSKDAIDKKAKEFLKLNELSLSEADFKKIQLTAQYAADQLLYKDNKEILAALDIKYAKDKEVLENEELAKKRERTTKGVEMAMSALSILNDAFQMSAGKSEKDQRKAFKAQKAFNLASALTNTFLAVTGALTAGGNPIKLATGMQFVEAGIAAAAGAVQVAKIAGTQFDSGANSSGGGDGATTPTMSAPQFNVVGQSGVNQLASLNQQPIQAYVVSGQVTSQQALDRNRLENATLGG
jgi:hypothetical protein